MADSLVDLIKLHLFGPVIILTLAPKCTAGLRRQLLIIPLAPVLIPNAFPHWWTGVLSDPRNLWPERLL